MENLNPLWVISDISTPTFTVTITDEGTNYCVQTYDWNLDYVPQVTAFELIPESCPGAYDGMLMVCATAGFLQGVSISLQCNTELTAFQLINQNTATTTTDPNDPNIVTVCKTYYGLDAGFTPCEIQILGCSEIYQSQAFVGLACGPGCFNTAYSWQIVEDENCLEGTYLDLTQNFNMPGVTYSWTGPGGFTANTPDIVPEEPGSYTMVVDIAGYDCVMGNTFDITITETEYEYPDMLYLNSGTYQFDGAFLEGIVINQGQTVTILNSNMDFAPDASIRIRPGAELILDNSTCRSAWCTALWWGVEIWGGQYQDVWDPAQLTMYDSGIWDARSIRNYRSDADTDSDNDGILDEPASNLEIGGKIYASESDFINNRQDFNFLKPYMFTTGSSLAEFNNCRFILDSEEDYKGDDVTVNRCYFRGQPLVDMKACYMVNGWGALLDEQLLVAIRLQNSGLNMWHPAGQTEFVGGFTYGVHAITSVKAKYQFTVSNIRFNCYRDVFASGYDFKTVSANIFEPLPDGGGTYFPGQPYPFNGLGYNNAGYGCYLQKGRFDLFGNIAVGTEGEAAYDYYGSIINDSGKSTSQIEGNAFANCQLGLYIWNRNRSAQGVAGVEILCNQFGTTLQQNTNDLYIWSPQYPFSAGAGIKELQGTQELGIKKSYANFFSQNNFTDYDDINSIALNYHLWYYRNIELDPDEVFDTEDGNFDWEIDNDDVDESIDCEEIVQIYDDTDRSGASTSYLNALDEWKEMTDGGNTEGLSEEVIMSDFTEALALYYELMSKSPALSIEVMIEAIKNEFALPPVLLTQILMSNPRAARSSEIREALDDRLIPLSDYQREQIQQAMNLLGEKEMLEFRMATLLSERNSGISYLRSQIQVEPTLPAATLGQLLALYEPELVLNDRLEKALLQAEWGNMETAATLLETAVDDYRVNDEDAHELADLMYVLTIEHDAPAALTANQVIDLEYILEAGGPLPSAIALSLLTEYTGYEYEEPTYAPTTPIEFRSEKMSTVEDHMQCYPNPTNTIAILTNLPIGSAVVLITDMSGKLYISLPVKERQECWLDFSGLPPGCYAAEAINARNEKLAAILITKQ